MQLVVNTQRDGYSCTVTTDGENITYEGDTVLKDAIKEYFDSHKSIGILPTHVAQLTAKYGDMLGGKVVKSVNVADPRFFVQHFVPYMESLNYVCNVSHTE